MGKTHTELGDNVKQVYISVRTPTLFMCTFMLMSSHGLTEVYKFGLQKG